MVTVGQLMNHKLVTGPGTMTTVEAARSMSAHRVGSILVEHDRHIVGIVTESDIVRKVLGNGQEPSLFPIGVIMSAPLIGIDERRPITEAADLMYRYGVRHLVVRKANAVVGILSVRDLLRPVSTDDF
ncbi:MAG: CBS domain-containing protein [Nitrospira sp.]|nr:CBS domain-containing protein [Nitrospira sp.]MCP9460968.1 CBS domain-containing protein [Nitrospira sp.]MCP9474524.1 CBS domain-containing protein [Nitrospira sp.]